MRNFFLLHLCLKSSLLTNKKCKVFDFQDLQIPKWNINSFLSLGLESPVS